MRKAIPVAIAVVIVGVLGVLVAQAQRLPTGPVPVVWDHEACAHCAMHVGEPRFAAQLQTEDGQVLNFDDPGCLLAYEAERHPRVHAVWFHHLEEDRWLPADRTAFVSADGTPMGWGLGAVEAGTPSTFDMAEAKARVAQRQADRRMP